MSSYPLGRLLVDIALVIAVAHAAGALLRRLGQPPVIGEILGGIAVGPSLLGMFPGNPSATLFPPTVRPTLDAIGNVGLVLYLFVVGLDFEIAGVGVAPRTLAAVSLGAIGLPFALGIGVAGMLYGSGETVAGHQVAFLPFALFVATALSITAFPVLARILSERELLRTPVGSLALASAAVQDGAGWLLLAIALAVFDQAGALAPLRLAAEATGLALIMALVLPPALRRLLQGQPAERPLQTELLAVLIAGLATCAGIAQLIGLHAAIGALGFGIAFPRSARPGLAAELGRTLLPVTLAVLLPFYFLAPGLAVNLRAVGSDGVWQLGAVITCACAGKLAGASLPARAAGLGWRDAATLGVLLNTRGLIEVVVLTVGLSRGVLNARVFGMLLAMALATTLLTGPLLGRLTRQQDHALDVVGLATN